MWGKWTRLALFMYREWEKVSPIGMRVGKYFKLIAESSYLEGSRSMFARISRVFCLKKYYFCVILRCIRLDRLSQKSVQKSCVRNAIFEFWKQKPKPVLQLSIMVKGLTQEKRLAILTCFHCQIMLKSLTMPRADRNQPFDHDTKQGNRFGFLFQNPSIAFLTHDF